MSMTAEQLEMLVTTGQYSWQTQPQRRRPYPVVQVGEVFYRLREGVNPAEVTLENYQVLSDGVYHLDAWHNGARSLCLVVKVLQPLPEEPRLSPEFLCQIETAAQGILRRLYDQAIKRGERVPWKLPELVPAHVTSVLLALEEAGLFSSPKEQTE